MAYNRITLPPRFTMTVTTWRGGWYGNGFHRVTQREYYHLTQQEVNLAVTLLSDFVTCGLEDRIKITAVDEDA